MQQKSRSEECPEINVLKDAPKQPNNLSKLQQLNASCYRHNGSERGRGSNVISLICPEPQALNHSSKFTPPDEFNDPSKTYILDLRKPEYQTQNPNFTQITQSIPMHKYANSSTLILNTYTKSCSLVLLDFYKTN